jgi:hypothetical protein
MERYERRRQLVAVVLLVVGGALIAVSITALYVMRDSTPQGIRQPTADRMPVGADVFLRWLAGIALILLIFAVGSLLMVRFSRRFRSRIMQSRSPATRVDDLWAMSRLPQEPMGDIPSPRVDPRPRPRRRRRPDQ